MSYIGRWAASTRYSRNRYSNRRLTRQWQQEEVYRRIYREEKRWRTTSKIGSFGTQLIFEISSSKVQIARDWKREQGSRWADHEILNAPPRSEFQGPEKLTTTMTVVFNAELGVRPKAMIATVEHMVRTGDVEYLVLGGQIYGWNAHKFLIKKASTSYDRVYNRGELVKATMDLTFEEYW